MIRSIAYPRAALIGNPSDGYFGKTIAFVFSNFKVEVELKEQRYLEIIPDNRDRLSFKSMDELTSDVNRNGYYGGIRLLKATIKTFRDYCSRQGIQLADKNFSITFSSDIPERLGLAGSSAIVTAAMNALMRFYAVEIDKPTLANLILAVEKEELKIGAGLQDRVAQVYNCPVLMNFDKKLMSSRGYGEYLPFDKKKLPRIYIAYQVNLSEASEILHNDLAARYAKKDAAVMDAVKQWIKLTEEVWKKLEQGDKNIGPLLNRNFDIRRKVCSIGAGNIELVETARSTGASAKFTGSGGAIIGTYEGERMYKSLTSAMKKIGAVVIKPEIV